MLINLLRVRPTVFTQAFKIIKEKYDSGRPAEHGTFDSENVV